jgi:hypothetical protein
MKNSVSLHYIIVSTRGIGSVLSRDRFVSMMLAFVFIS